MVQQGIIAGCAGGTYTNVMEAAHALRGKNCGCDEFSLAVYPSSQPVFSDLVKKRGAVSIYGCRRCHPHRFLTSLLWCRRYTLQQWFKYPSYHQKLPEP